MKIKSADSQVKLSVLMLCITSYFYAMLGNGYVLLAISVVPIIFLFFSYVNKLESNMFPWFMFLLFAVISSLFTTQFEESIKFVLALGAYFVLKLVLQREFNWWSAFLKIVYVFSAFNVLGVFLSLLAPDFMLNFAMKMYSGENLKLYIRFFQNETYCGWNAQTGITGFFVSIFIALVVSDMLSNTKKTINYPLLAVGIIALLLTKKRSLLIGNMVAILFLFRNAGKSKKSLNKIFIILLIGVIVFFIAYYSVAWQGFLEKWEVLGSEGDISNGRFALWEETFDMWKKAPFFGVGTNVLAKEYNLSSHNVFLQLMAEMGIFGAVTYVFLLLSSLKQGVSALKNFEQTSLVDLQTEYMLSASLYVQILFIVYSFFGNPVYGIHIMLLFTAFTALPGAYNNYLRMKNNENRDTDIS